MPHPNDPPCLLAMAAVRLQLAGMHAQAHLGASGAAAA